MNKEVKEPKNIKLPEQENKEENKKIGFGKRIWASIKDFEKYQEFASEKVTTALGYLVKLVLIFVIIATLFSLYRFHNGFQSFIRIFDEKVEEMELAEGVLTVKQEEAIYLENTEFLNGKIIIDTITENQTVIDNYVTDIKETEESLVFLKDRILYKAGILAEPIEYSYQDLTEGMSSEIITKQDILEFVNPQNLVVIYATMFGIMLIYLFILYFASTLVDVFILSFLGFFTSKLAGLKIRYSALFNMGVYAITLPIILNILYVILNSLTGFKIEYFQVMYTTISYIYIVTAILLIKSDLIKKQYELMKIQEEQEKIREELRRKEEEEKLKQEQEERRKRREEKRKQEQEKQEQEEKEKKKEKKEKEKTLGKEGPTPQGNNA